MYIIFIIIKWKWYEILKTQVGAFSLCWCYIYLIRFARRNEIYFDYFTLSGGQLFETLRLIPNNGENPIGKSAAVAGCGWWSLLLCSHVGNLPFPMWISPIGRHSRHDRAKLCSQMQAVSSGMCPPNLANLLTKWDKYFPFEFWSDLKFCLLDFAEVLARHPWSNAKSKKTKINFRRLILATIARTVIL